jgi:hypothetical protein
MPLRTHDVENVEKRSKAVSQELGKLQVAKKRIYYSVDRGDNSQHPGAVQRVDITP